MSHRRTFLARQPILDTSRRLVGYELLFRAGPGSESCDVAPDMATAQLISSTLVDWNFEVITGGQPGFVKMTRRLLLEGLPKILPPQRMVLEVPGTVAPEPEVISACRGLIDQGYRIAVDGFSMDRHEGFLPIARFVKVDLRITSPEERTRIVRACGVGGPVPIALGVETEADFAAAKSEGFRQFQGFFFGQPQLREGGRLLNNQMQLLRLLGALRNPDLRVDQLEDLVKTDVQVCYMVLRTVNSAASAIRMPITSIRQALVMLGRDTVRRWVSLWLMAGVGATGHPELLAMAAARARACEQIVWARGDDGADGFLAGMCSLLDVLLHCPMSEVLEHLPLTDEARAALLGESNPTRDMLDAVVAYERGDWDACMSHARRAGIAPEAIAAAYGEGFEFASHLAEARAA